MTDKKETPTEFVAKVSVKLPDFWTEDPNLWFHHAEAAFRNAQIPQSITKFDHIVQKLPQKIMVSVRGLIMGSAASSETPYEDYWNVLAPGSPSTRGINSHRSLSVCNEESPSKGRSAAGSTRPSRKASVSSLGEHLSTLMSMSTQVCATLGEKVSSRRQSLTPNDISDNIITNIKSSMKER
ncbi:uncharacterized protein LOC111701727 [Eurytemora carolleeae]|uniref:uncharacterized protein LOC111701727 n=1 Tax=Eurytemora carolleeae TaxID=1294199 RepID=UPI000C786131|nr:uncharacterized protein LOC111701727 [Eurytemora carolleeae]|eukprot:XP_023328904.1 uncharacterized protein LOC111701727 [Eurytemora affinis]